MAAVDFTLYFQQFGLISILDGFWFVSVLAQFFRSISMHAVKINHVGKGVLFFSDSETGHFLNKCDAIIISFSTSLLLGNAVI